MIAQVRNQQQLYRTLYQPQELLPTASQILSEIDKILRTSTDPVQKRPQVRQLIKNIVEAVVPPINLMNLLKNPMTEPQNRDTIIAALKLITQAKNNAANAMKTQAPTEQQLRAHMDAILQDAIIKKRMENLSNELWRMPYQQGGRNFPNQSQSFHQMFQTNSAGRFQNNTQSDSRGQGQPVENGSNLNRWFPSTLLQKGLVGDLPQIPINKVLRSEELEENMIGNEKEVK